MDKQNEAAEQLFGEAFDLPRDRRPAFLDSVCAGDPGLRHDVEDLLDSHDRLNGFLSEPAHLQALAATGTPSQTVLLTAGTRLLQRYVIVGRLGAGGMGVVYRARDEKLNRDIAIKMLQRGMLKSEEARVRFRREAQALAKLNHAHIAAVYDVIEQDGADCIVMELVEGESLAAKLRRGALPAKEATNFALQVAEALEDAHERGVIHRDLKPANVMITSKGQAKVLDFGLARLLLGPADLTWTGAEAAGVMGTPLYMSPEQAIGNSADARSDLWSLGVTYYESLTGIEAFRRPTTLAILRAITEDTVLPLRQLSPQTPPLAEQVVARALEKNAELRYHHAGDLATDLRRVLRDLEAGRWSAAGTRAEPVSSVTAGAAPVRRIWLRWVGLAAAVLILAGVGLVLLTPAAPATGPSWQLTSTNEEKLGPLRTDGARIYLESHNIPSEMSVSGGMITPVPGLTSGMHLSDISPDGSKILVWAKNINNETTGAGYLFVGSTLGGALQKIGSMQDVHWSARWSTDGGAIYFIEGQKVWVMDANGYDARVLWKPPDAPIDLAVSPDGKQLAVTTYPKINGLDMSRQWLVGVDGKDAHLLVVDGLNGADMGAGQWTPDGQHFVFSSGAEGRANFYELIKPRWFEFWKKPKAVRLTGNQVDVTEGVPSRDSKSLFVLAGVDSGSMQVFDPRVARLVPFLGGQPMLRFVVSPDRQWMAYEDYPFDHLWKSRVDGSEAVQLTPFGSTEQWSPDGKWIAYAAGKIWRVPADGGTPQMVTAKAQLPADQNEDSPTWSPDGKSIIFNRTGYWVEPDGLYVADLESGNVTPFPGGEKFYNAAWSPDGKYLVAMAREPLRMVIYSAATKQWRTLIQFDAPAGFYAWSPDSRSLYMAQTQAHAGMYRVSVPDGARLRISNVPDVNVMNVAFVSVTADGQPAIMAHAGAAQVYSMQWK